MNEPTTAGGVMLRCLHHWNLMKSQVIPRCCLTGWEADLLVIRPSGWAEEVEIKISKSDFRAEWTKKAEKHEDLRLGGCPTDPGYTKELERERKAEGWKVV